MQGAHSDAAGGAAPRVDGFHARLRLRSLDLSFCRAISNDAVGAVVDASPRLRRLVVWGCTQLSERLFDGHRRALAVSDYTVRVRRASGRPGHEQDDDNDDKEDYAGDAGAATGETEGDAVASAAGMDAAIQDLCFACARLTIAGAAHPDAEAPASTPAIPAPQPPALPPAGGLSGLAALSATLAASAISPAVSANNASAQKPQQQRSARGVAGPSACACGWTPLRVYGRPGDVMPEPELDAISSAAAAGNAASVGSATAFGGGAGASWLDDGSDVSDAE